MKIFIFIMVFLMVFTACRNSSKDEEVSSSSSPSPSLDSNREVGSSSSSGATYNKGLAVLDRIELNVQREKWEALKYTNYQFTYDMSSTRFPPVYFTPVIVKVSEGKIIKVSYIDSGEILPLTEYSTYDIQTIDEWFYSLEALIDFVPDALYIQYNDNFGYLESISYDYALGGHDGASMHTIRELN